MNAPRGLGYRAVSGAAYTGVSQVLRVLLSMCSTIVVARLLLPGDFGVIAMASPIMAFLLIFQDLGLNQAVVQHDSITAQQLNAMFWLNIFGSAAIALVLLAISPAVAYFYHDARAGYITAAFSANVLLGGAALQHTALLNRKMNFALAGKIEIATAATSLVGTAAFAYFLRNYWSLWLGALFSTIVNVTLLWIFVDWRPRAKLDFTDTRSLVGFGANVTIFNISNFLHRNADNLLIARVWGAYQLGLYDRAYKLMTFPLQTINTPLGRVMVPILSRLQTDPQRYRRTFLLAIRAILILSVPGIAVAASMSDRLIPLLLGDRWASASPIFFWLSLAAFTSPLSNATGWLFISCGNTKPYAHWGIFSGAVTVTAFLIGLPWGATGVARAYAICMTLVIAPLLYLWAPRSTPVSTRDLYRVLAEPFAAAAVTFFIVKLISPHISTILLLCVALPISYGLAVAFQFSTGSGRLAFKTIIRMISQTVVSRRGGNPADGHDDSV